MITNNVKDKKEQSKFDKFVLSGKFSLAAFGSAFVVQVLHPFDIIKTRFQSHDGQTGKNLVPKYHSVRDAFQQIYKDEGFKGYYKGFYWTLFANSISRVLFFTLYESIKQGIHDTGVEIKEKHIVASSLTSGVIASFITTPLWVIKTRMLLNTRQQLTGMQNVKSQIASIYKEHGIQGYWRGLSVSLPLCLHGVIQMTVFENVLLLQKKLNLTDEDTTEGHVQNNTKQSSVAGFTSKICAIMVTYPLQTLRTRLQQTQMVNNQENYHKYTPKYKNIRHLVMKMLRKEGVTSFYKGVTPSLLMNAPSNAIYFFFYEFFKEQLGINNKNRLE